MQSITATELKQKLDNGEDVQIVDVREDSEVAIGRIPNSIHIPLAQVVGRMSEIDPSRDTVVHCKMGGRSARAIEALERSGYTGSLSNLTGLVQRRRPQRAQVLTVPRSLSLPSRFCLRRRRWRERAFKCRSQLTAALPR